MKKYFVIIASMLLFFTFANAQTYPKCNVCNGNKTVYKKSGVKQVCKNCKDWADSYRNIVGCDFCKNKKFIWGPGYEYCKKCNGTGKGAEQRNKEYAEAVKFFEEEEAKRNSSLQRLNTYLTEEFNTKKNERKEEFLKNGVVIIGNLKVMKKDLGSMNWDDAVSECEALGEGWRLPSINELIVLYKNKDKIGGFNENCYWSSKEGSSYEPKIYGIPSGNIVKYGLRVCFFGAQKSNSEEECDKKIYQGVRAVHSEEILNETATEFKNLVFDEEPVNKKNYNNNIEKKDENLEGLEDELPSSLNKKDYNSEKVQGEHLPNNLKQKSKVKKDDYYFSVNSHDVNIKSKNNSTSIKDNSGGVNLFDKILTVRDKEVLKIENWKTITFAKSIKDNRGDVIGVKFKNKYAPLGDKSRHYQLMDGEAFELAKRYVQQANERSKYE